jgi:hypothetical protein
LLWSSFCPLSKLAWARIESSHKDAVDFSVSDTGLAQLGIKYNTKGTVQQGVDGRLVNRAALWAKLWPSNRMKPVKLLTVLQSRMTSEIRAASFNYTVFRAWVVWLATMVAATLLHNAGIAIWDPECVYGIPERLSSKCERPLSGMMAVGVLTRTMTRLETGLGSLTEPLTFGRTEVDIEMSHREAYMEENVKLLRIVVKAIKLFLEAIAAHGVNEQIAIIDGESVAANYPTASEEGNTDVIEERQ